MFLSGSKLQTSVRLLCQHQIPGDSGGARRVPRETHPLCRILCSARTFRARPNEDISTSARTQHLCLQRYSEGDLSMTSSDMYNKSQISTRVQRSPPNTETCNVESQMPSPPRVSARNLFSQILHARGLTVGFNCYTLYPHVSLPKEHVLHDIGKVAFAT